MARRNLIGFLVLFAITLTFTEGVNPPGGAVQLTGSDLEEAVQTLKDTLAKLEAGEGPTYSVVKVFSATSQVVSGILTSYRVNLKLSSKKVRKCDVKIWSQPWLEKGTQITIACSKETTVVRKLD